MSFWEWLFGPPAPQAPPAAKPKPAPAMRTLSKSQFETLVVARAALLAGGAFNVNAMHYALARDQIARELKEQGTTVKGLQSKGISEAAAEAGGADKI